MVSEGGIGMNIFPKYALIIYLRFLNSFTRQFKGSGMTKSIKCPIDNHKDEIYKISGIVLGGTVDTSLSGPTTSVSSDGDSLRYGVGSAQLAGKSQTGIAETLSRPERPGGIGCLPYFLPLGGWVLLSTAFDNAPFGIALGMIIGAGFSFYWPYKMYKDNQANQNEYDEIYKTANPIWERSYYCSRHSICFDPKTGNQWDPNETKHLFY
jgi:hypothetical protein